MVSVDVPLDKILPKFTPITNTMHNYIRGFKLTKILLIEVMSGLG